ncbi:MAG: hypothetical protein CL565_02010 [Alphaproteobacteria bacterium]|nr:hypothetical protein [Alphaproteobacteria bacterium]|tara:strand:- start:406 stop:1263 length:858 start_codon:yes stop_codon:yes gene_type:complete
MKSIKTFNVTLYLAFACLFLFTVVPTSQAQTTGPSPSSPSASDTCDPEIREAMNSRYREQVLTSQTVAQTFHQRPAPTADMVCLPDQLASFANTGGKIFVDNSTFFNAIKTGITMPTTIKNTVLTTLASFLSGNPFSTSNITDVLGGILGFTMPSTCDAMEQDYVERVMKPIPKSVTDALNIGQSAVNPASAAGNPSASDEQMDELEQARNDTENAINDATPDIMSYFQTTCSKGEVSASGEACDCSQRIVTQINELGTFGRCKPNCTTERVQGNDGTENFRCSE